jgi:hypothetical protein
MANATFPPTPLTGPVLAIDVRKGDRLVHDGRELTVTADPSGTWYCANGQHIAGLAITCAAGTAKWTLYRKASDILHRVRTDV